jgi:osmotically-inducible protein OsmY
MKLNQFRQVIIGLLTITILSGCAVAAISAVTIATVDIIHDRRTVGEYIDDSAIEVKARNFLLADPEIRKNAHVNPTSWNGIVLLTGEVANENIKQQISNTISAYDAVRQVVDETVIENKARLLSRSNDTWITSKVKTKLLAKMGTDGNRIKVVTERSNVYLMGIVNENEATRATDIARNTRGVSRVIKVFEYQ